MEPKIEQPPACAHRNKRDVGSSAEGMGSIIVYWCPDCGGLKKRMTNWKHTDYPWELPARTTFWEGVVKASKSLLHYVKLVRKGDSPLIQASLVDAVDIETAKLEQALKYDDT